MVPTWMMGTALGVGFAFGAGLAYAIDSAAFAHSRKRQHETAVMFEQLMLAARDVLSDAFYKRLCRRFGERMETVAKGSEVRKWLGLKGAEDGK